MYMNNTQSLDQVLIIETKINQYLSMNGSRHNNLYLGGSFD